MSSSVSFASALIALAPLLAATFLAGSLTQLTRQLARPKAPPLRLALAQATAAGIAALSVSALLSAAVSPAPDPALLLAFACVTGWSGPRILSRLGGLIEKWLGLHGPDTRSLEESLAPDPGILAELQGSHAPEVSSPKG
ncbi:hypothetical protein DEDE109153_12995 [Deinococcus deserti]|uniref:Holin n=1 Tax=Deinococcus deserti (strain DSM 17065 / CIP 109153 / LMG 22923 / VCD115) TaxID=546414 RepID=C1CY97_DEIDV|nr:hypothetical protein [Deinococcus deserti]ACO44918.1 Hypothetical protein, precursor [Deinococcus deserti VCD115]